MAEKRSYFWALHFERSDPEVRALSRRAMDGFEYASSLARNAKARREAGLTRGMIPERLRPADLDASSAIEVNTAIKQARIELFGKDLSDSAIAYRLSRRRAHAEACAEPGCPNTVPRLAHGRQRYCRNHGSGRARIARHRRGAAEHQGISRCG